ncbi:hypothetical protein NBRC116592_19900 [Colwellia sp. KU-HH00111]
MIIMLALCAFIKPKMADNSTPSKINTIFRLMKLTVNLILRVIKSNKNISKITAKMI